MRRTGYLCKAVKIFPNSGWFQFKDFLVHFYFGYSFKLLG